MDNAMYVSLLFQASKSRFGLKIATDDAAGLKSKLYNVRRIQRDLGNSTFDNLSLRTSPTRPDQELWIVPVMEHANA